MKNLISMDMICDDMILKIEIGKNLLKREKQTNSRSKGSLRIRTRVENEKLGSKGSLRIRTSKNERRRRKVCGVEEQTKYKINGDTRVRKVLQEFERVKMKLRIKKKSVVDLSLKELATKRHKR